MGNLVLAGATSGSTTITPTDGVTATLTLPSTTGTLALAGASSSSISNGTSNVTVNSSGGTVSITTAGTTALTVSTGQFVGIGTTSPAKVLNIATSATTEVWVESTSTQKAILSLYAGDTSVGITSTYNTGGSAARPFVFNNVSTPLLQFDVNKSLALQGASTQTGTGISFPATQSASSNVNTLDDYEEGTFTPTILFGGNNTGMVYNRQYATYTKIGNRVFINIYVSISPTKGSSTGTATVAGLPFQNVNDPASGNGAETPCAFNPPQILYSGIVTAYVENNATYIQLGTVTEGGFNSGMSDANFQGNSAVLLMCHYQTS